jgi:hypothetical protein
MTNETPSHTGVVDPSLLDTSDAGDIPAFLKRGANAPVFATQEDAAGQTELVVHEGEQVLAALPDQEKFDETLSNMLPHQEVEHEMPQPEVPVEATVGVHSLEFRPEDTSQGNEALIANAPSQIERVDDMNNEDEGDTSGPGAGHNAPADPAEMRRDFFKDINKFGKASGEGASALGRLGLRALRAAADGVISTAKPQGGGKDDATLIYEAYTAMDSKHSEHTAGGAKANASKLRQIIGMGCMTTLSDPVAVGDRVVRIHEEMTDAELKPKALFAALVDVAREQQASDTELTDAAIRDALTKTKADKTLEKEWESIHKKVEALVTGEGSHGLKDQSETAIKIVELVGERLKQYKSDGTRADRIDQMVELGYTRAQAEAIVDKKISV